jgi:ABC-2 type transport system ATP-binding protein
MLQVRQISKTFGSTRAVNQLNLTVEKGQICGLLGPNGAGKSTTIRIICGVLIPNSGTVEIDGIDLATNPSRAKQSLGYVPEGAPLPLELLPSEYLSSMASLYGLSGTQKKEAIYHWAKRCDISNVLQKPIGTLSRGYRQRVALTAALLHEPTLLILDEPSTGLDPVQRATFQSLLREVAEHAAVLYSSHHLAEVEATCDVTVIINHGELIENHRFSELMNKDNQTIEVSSKEVAKSIGGEDLEELENGWVRCLVERSAEEIVELVQKNGGNVRLIQPTTQSLESKYLELILDSEAGQ